MPSDDNRPTLSKRMRDTIRAIKSTPAEKYEDETGVSRFDREYTNSRELARFGAEMLPTAGFTTGIQKGGTEGGIDALAEAMGFVGGAAGSALGPLGTIGGYAAGKGGTKLARKALKNLSEFEYPKPRTTWWLDDSPDPDTVTLYHGTNKKNLKKVQEEGLKQDREGYSYASPDPDSGFGYASMSGDGGEKAFRAAGSKAKHVPNEDRILLKLEVPKKVIEENMALQRSPRSKDLLLNKTKDDFNKIDPLRFIDPNDPVVKKYGPKNQDKAYYSLTEFRFKGDIPPEYIKGYATKDSKALSGNNAIREMVESLPDNIKKELPEQPKDGVWGYHGSSKGRLSKEGEKYFDTSFGNPNDQFLGEGFYFTINPRVAEEYANLRATKDFEATNKSYRGNTVFKNRETGQEATTASLMKGVDMNNEPLLKGQNVGRFNLKNIKKPYVINTNKQRLEAKKNIDKIKAEGYDSILFKDFADRSQQILVFPEHIDKVMSQNKVSKSSGGSIVAKDPYDLYNNRRAI